MSTDHIRLSTDRAEQLRALAEVRRSTVAGLVDDLVSAELRSGDLPDTTPCVTIARGNDGQVTLTVEGVALPPLPAGELNDLAGYLENPKTAKGAEKRLVAFYGENGDTMAEVGHVGRAIEFKITHAGASARKVMTPSVARDLARQLRAAAA